MTLPLLKTGEHCTDPRKTEKNAAGLPLTALSIGSPGVGKSHIAKALALHAVQRGYTVFYREAHVLVDDIHQARELGELKKYRATIKAAGLVVIDDLFLRKLPPNAGDELAGLIMSRYEKSSTLITSNRDIDDCRSSWATPSSSRRSSIG